MKHNLMGKDKIENLGFSDVNSWENETEVNVFDDLLEEEKFVQEASRDR